MLRHRLNLSTALILVMGGTMGAAASAIAQDAASEDKAPSNGVMLESITVTAERRTEDVQNVPVSVQAVSSEKLEASHITGLIELQKVTPSLVVQDAASNVNPYIRGIGSTTQGAGYYASVATYVDSVYVTRLSSGHFDLDAVESIQVLKGPQGTLYGRNATGGAIIVTSRTPRPGDPMQGHVSATYGSFDEQNVSGHVSAGVSDMVAISVGGSYRKRDGYIDNLNPPGFGPHNEDLNSRDYYSFNAALNVEPTDRLGILLRASIYHQDDRKAMGLQAVGLDHFVDNATLASLGLPPDPAIPLNGTQAYFAGLLGAFAVPGAAAEAMAAGLTFSNEIGATYDNELNGFQGALRVNGAKGSFNAGEIQTGSVRIRYEFDAATITSTTSFTRSTSETATEIITADPASYPIGFPGAVGFSGDFPAHNVQEDLQIASNSASPVEWLVGGNYLREHGLTDLTGDLFGFNIQSELNNWTVESAAVFAQMTLPLDTLLEGLSFTGGGRYTSDSYELEEEPGFGTFRNDISSDAVTYTARLNYQIADDLLLYGGVVTGFKSGSLNATNHLSPGVSPEEITSFEIGAKWDVTSRFRLNAAAFNYQYEDIHLQVTSSPLAASFLVNGTGARVYGLDFEASALLADWATLDLGGMILQSEYDEDVVAGGFGSLATGGKRLAGAPEWAFNISPVFVIPFVTNGALELRINAAFNSGYYFDAENIVGTGGAFDAKAFTTVDFNLGYTPPGERWRLSVWGSNAFDETYFNGGLVAGQINKLAIAAPPAQFGATLNVNF